MNLCADQLEDKGQGFSVLQYLGAGFYTLPVGYTQHTRSPQSSLINSLIHDQGNIQKWSLG